MQTLLNTPGENGVGVLTSHVFFFSYFFVLFVCFSLNNNLCGMHICPFTTKQKDISEK